MSFFKNKLSRGQSLRVPADEGSGSTKRSKLSSLFARSSRRREGAASPISPAGMMEAASATLGRGPLQRKGSTYRHLAEDSEPADEWAPVPPGFVETDFSYYSRDFNHYESDRVERERRRQKEAERRERRERRNRREGIDQSATVRARPSPRSEGATGVARSHSTRALGSNNPFNPHGTIRRQPPPPQPIWVQFENDAEPRSSSGSDSSR